MSPRISTSAVSGDTDDPAIWIHPTDPAQSQVIGTDKIGNDMYVWDMNGQQRQRIPISRYPNNGDVRYGMPVDIYVVGAECPSRLVIFRIDSSTRQLSDLTASGATSTPEVKDPDGVCLYRRARDGAMYAFVNSNGGVAGVLNQYQLLEDGNRRVRMEFVRSFGGDVNGNHSEGMVAEDELGYVYTSEEDCCIHRSYADPDMGNQQLAVFDHSDDIASDREGLAIYACPTGTGYLLLSSQGNQRVKVYRREGDAGNPHSHTLLTTIYAADASSTDGLDVTNRPAGPNFRNGFLAKHHSAGKYFKLFAWEDIGQSYLTTCGVTSDFTVTATSGCAPLTVTFTDLSTGPVTAWEWNFGDNTSSTEQHPTHTYTAEGNYIVQLRVTNTCGESIETKADYIRVRACTPPLAKFAGTPVLGNVPLQVSFIDSSTGNPTSWSWDFGGGNTATEQQRSHRYVAPGEYTVSLQVANGYDTSVVQQQNFVTVVDTLAAAFSAELTAGCAPLAVQFTDQSSGSVTSWMWDSGDGSISAEPNPLHTYANADTYHLKLTVSNGAGQSHTATKNNYITVSAAPLKVAPPPCQQCVVPL